MGDYLAISALQHYAYCPRQFALIHLEQAWEENRFTAEGRLLHERVDSGLTETRDAIRYERDVSLECRRHALRGKADLLEVHLGTSDNYFPVEYKRGKPKVEDWDRIQLCAQALCIEEMLATEVTEGAIWYWEVRRRERVNIDDALRLETTVTISRAKAVLDSGVTPAPTDDESRCRGCSLRDLCEPETFRQDWSGRYVESIGE